MADYTTLSVKKNVYNELLKEMFDLRKKKGTKVTMSEVIDSLLKAKKTK